MSIKNIISNFSGKNYKAYILFLSLTLVLWFSIQMTKTYSFNSQIEINIENIPKYIIVDSLNQNLDFSIEANGLKLWKYNLSEHKYQIPFNAVEKDSSVISINTSKVKDFIANEFDFEPQNLSIHKSFLYYPYSKRNSKLVPVVVNSDLHFGPGYNTLDSVKVEPDSVRISGTEEELKQIKSITTQKLELKNIKDTIRQVISLKNPNKRIDLSTTQVSIFLPVEKFSENALMINVSLINVPDTIDLNIFPDKAKVSFLVALKHFDKVSELDFNVVCNYDRRYPDKGIMIPKLKSYPDNIINPKLHTKKIDYLIKQKK